MLAENRRSNALGAGQAPETFALYGEAPGQTGLEHIHIEDIKARARLYDWTITPHAHADLWQFIHIEKGRAEATVENGYMRLGDHSVLSIPNGVVHGFEFETDTIGWVLSIETRLLETQTFAQARKLLVRNGFHVTKLDLKPPHSEESGVFFRRLHDEFAHMRQARSAMLDSLTNALLILLMREARQGKSDDADASQATGLLAAYRDLINQRFREHLSVVAYASALGVSQSRLARACRRLAGQSPAALINARLLLEAQRNLHFTEASAAQIAIDLGFQDPAYFSRFFKRMTGLTPREYREKSRKKQGR
ncbi:helix-turn-helix domain-containing protein [Hyphococcus luteus]|uniref:HTH araC/xylS-type domain-containing protein n=1 Tax=Hyphococcus luteus TaxID=2058213 RepID=A0A2S7K585_9PROT|nr:helix-turn-helix domain-containing protein [Marinicaulis flavus]PQA87677.1 hypothetical protein CW354_11425 [Marinicaulis flavus]